MKTTRIIENVDRYKNRLTKYGRNKNSLIKELEKHGFTEFRERTLKDKSQVMLAYKPDKDLAEFSCRFFPDLSMLQKYIVISRFTLFSIPKKTQRISKLFIDNKGKCIKEDVKKMRYENNSFVEKNENIWDIKTDTKIEKTERPSGWLELGKKYTKSYEKTWDNNSYQFLEDTDGVRYYIKEVDGVGYTFSSK